jgi:hypothetical protein
VFDCWARQLTAFRVSQALAARNAPSERGLRAGAMRGSVQIEPTGKHVVTAAVARAGVGATAERVGI